MISNTNTLEARLRRLERSNRRWRLVVVSVALVAPLLSAVPQAAEHLRVRGIDLVDAEGRVRATLAVDGDGPGLHLLDESGVRRASLVHTDDETALFLRDSRGDTRAGAAHFAHGGSGFALHGPGGEGGLVLYLREEGTLTYYGADGAILARFPEP